MPDRYHASVQPDASGDLVSVTLFDFTKATILKSGMSVPSSQQYPPQEAVEILRGVGQHSTADQIAELLDEAAARALAHEEHEIAEERYAEELEREFNA